MISEVDGNLGALATWGIRNRSQCLDIVKSGFGSQAHGRSRRGCKNVGERLADEEREKGREDEEAHGKLLSLSCLVPIRCDRR